jgi:hypothetical protein
MLTGVVLVLQKPEEDKIFNGEVAGNQSGQNRGQDPRKPESLVRASFALVVWVLKPVLRGQKGRRAGFKSRHDQAFMKCRCPHF